MITGEIKNKIDNIWQKLWAAGMANPLTCIEQLSYLMFIRSLDDIELETEQKENMMGIKGNHIFAENQQKLRWSKFKNLSPDEIFSLMKDESNGIYQGKKYFYIFDWLRNFEFFRVNKDGIKGSETVSLTESIFCRRVELIKELQAAEFQTQEYEKYRNDLVLIVNRQIRELKPNQRADVHLKRKYVLKFQDIENFNNLSAPDVEELKKHIASLVYMDETDIYAKGFDNLVYALEVLKCQKKNFSKQQNQIINDATILLKSKANIDQVKAQIPLLTRLADESYYTAASILDLEEMRLKIRELIKFLVESKQKPVRYVDYIDTALSVGEGTPVYTANNFEAYQKKVNSYIAEHLDDESIMKLRNNVRLTQDDYDKLNDVFTKELGTSEQFEKISDGKPPFDRPGKFFSLFSPKAQKQLVAIIRSINENAHVA